MEVNYSVHSFVRPVTLVLSSDTFFKRGWGAFIYPRFKLKLFSKKFHQSYYWAGLSHPQFTWAGVNHSPDGPQQGWCNQPTLGWWGRGWFLSPPPPLYSHHLAQRLNWLWCILFEFLLWGLVPLLYCHTQADLVSLPFTLLCVSDIAFFSKVKVCGNPALSKSVRAIFSTHYLLTLHFCVTSWPSSHYFNPFHYCYTCHCVLWHCWSLLFLLQEDYDLVKSRMMFSNLQQ